MARTSNVAKMAAIETKALAADSKSEGMRLLLNAGYKVAQVAAVMSAPYAFVYGVAKRAGLAETAAERRLPKGVAATKAVKSSSKVTNKAAAAKAASKPVIIRKAAAKVLIRAAKVPSKVSVVKAQLAAKAAARAVPVKARASHPPTVLTIVERNGARLQPVAKVTKVAGRPNAARRAANRKEAITSHAQA